MYWNPLPLVVSVKQKFLPRSFSTLRAYSTNCFTTSQFISGSPPKKSISRLVRPPSVMLATTRLLYHMGNIFRDNAPIPAATGIQIDRKRPQELQRKRIALGYKPDDHELEPQGYTMQFH